jgi:DNA primase
MDSTSLLVDPEPVARRQFQGSDTPAEALHSPAGLTLQDSTVSFASHQDQDFKEQVRQATDIVELVGSFLSLRRQGNGYVALCPWHDDTKPSLNVNAKRQSWKCWVCDVGGDVFSFVMQHERIGFREALELLADKAGIAPPRTMQPRTEPGSPDDKRTLYQASRWAEEQFHRCLLHDPAAEPAREYLRDRGISAESIQQFQLGFSPPDWTWLLQRARQRFSPQVLVAAGLCGRSETSGKYYDRFRGRVIFPIRDVQDKTIAFGGRILPSQTDAKGGKYVNSPDTRLFLKNEHLYGLNLARNALTKDREIVVVEGYTDTIMAHQVGMRQAVAVLGTALGENHIRLLKRFADRITLVLDGDEAGQRRTNEILELFVAAQVDLRVLTLPEQLDPCDFLLQQGKEAFEKMLDDAVDALEHKVRIATQGIDLVRDTHRANQALEDILGTMARAPKRPAEVAGPARLREHQILARLARHSESRTASCAPGWGNCSGGRTREPRGAPGRKPPSHPRRRRLRSATWTRATSSCWKSWCCIPNTWPTRSRPSTWGNCIRRRRGPFSIRFTGCTTNSGRRISATY